MKSVTSIACLLLALFAFTGYAAAAETKEELQKRFAKRDGELRRLKADGVVGETDAGFVDFVSKRTEPASSLVDEENSDRRKLYALIARSTETSEEEVAKTNAQRNFDRAKPGEYLKIKGKWQKK